MKILTISGSIRTGSTNTQLLDSLSYQFPAFNFERFDLSPIPLFHPDKTESPFPVAVVALREKISNADAVIICTPAYIFNIPGVLKNALDWLASSGELNGKSTIAMIYTPAEPRGAKAMQSLLWSLQALDAQVVVSLSFYQSNLQVSTSGKWKGEEAIEMMQEALGLLGR